MLNIFDWMRGRSINGQTATKLYGLIVAQARQPVFFTRFGVEDVAETRYEMIVLHIVLVLERLRASGDQGMVIAQALTEAFVRDLDGSMRELAVSDVKVPAKVKKAAGGLYDRDVLYRQAFVGTTKDGPDHLTTAGLIDELIYKGTQSPQSTALLHYVNGVRTKLEGWVLSDGTEKLRFPEADSFLQEAE